MLNMPVSSDHLYVLIVLMFVYF